MTPEMMRMAITAITIPEFGISKILTRSPSWNCKKKKTPEMMGTAMNATGIPKFGIKKSREVALEDKKKKTTPEMMRMAITAITMPKIWKQQGPILSRKKKSRGHLQFFSKKIIQSSSTRAVPPPFFEGGGVFGG